MPSRRPVRSALPIAFGVGVIVAVGSAAPAVARAAPPTTVAEHTTRTAPTTAPGQIVLLPPTTAVLTVPVASEGVPGLGSTGTPAEVGPHAATLPHTL